MSHRRVDLQQLLEAIRDAQPGALEETILAELIARALAARATTIRVQPDTQAATLTILDDGRGMQRKALRRHHSLAAGSRPPAQRVAAPGIGFKLALLVADEVLTETSRGAAQIAASWYLATRYRAPFTWIPAPGLVASRGTAVRLRLANPLSPLLDPGFLEEAIRAHFEPLLDPALDQLLRRRYPDGIRFEVGGAALAPRQLPVLSRVTVPIRIGRRRTPSAIAVLERHDGALPDDRHGIAISTRGRVVRRGWDWLGLAPAAPFRITGLVEAPELASSLAPGGNDFIRSGPRAATYIACRKAIRAAVAEQLTAWGDTLETDARPRVLRLNLDLERTAAALSSDFPLLRSLLEQQPDAQKPLPLHPRGELSLPSAGGANGYRLLMDWSSRAGDNELGRLVGRTLSINDAHPAYLRASESRAAGYHTAVAVALALAPVVAPSQEHAFVSQFLATWGGAGRTGVPSRERRKKRPRP